MCFNTKQKLTLFRVKVSACSTFTALPSTTSTTGAVMNEPSESLKEKSLRTTIGGASAVDFPSPVRVLVADSVADSVADDPQVANPVFSE